MTAFYIFYIVVVSAIVFLFARGSLLLGRALRSRDKANKKGLWKGIVIWAAWAIVLSAVVIVTGYFVVGALFNSDADYAGSGSGDFFSDGRRDELPAADRPVFEAPTPTPEDGGEDGGDGEPEGEYVLTFEDGSGGEALPPVRVKPNGTVTLMPMPDRDGDAFHGWYADRGYREPVSEVTMDSDKTVYASWRAKSSSPLHLPYLLQDRNKNFNPYGGVTWGDMLVMFSLVVTDGKGVSGSAAIIPGDADSYGPLLEVMRGHGVAEGFPDGAFRPEANASRAELIAVCVRVAALLDGREGFTRERTRDARSFPDVPDWAGEAAAAASGWGWLDYMDDYGEYDGAFPMNGDVTRMEAAVIVNRLLRRECDEAYADSHESLECADVPLDMWARYDIIEASTAHTYTLTSDSRERWRAAG
jgi:uncharacterized repeat protein (TIGR02543 family)